MKKIILGLTMAIAVLFTAGTITAQTKYSDDDYNKFKKESMEKISDNEKKIADLRVKKAKSNSEVKDEMYEARIAALEEGNKNLKKKVTDYKDAKDHSNCSSFKDEVNHDLKELGQALKDFTVDNKK